MTAPHRMPAPRSPGFRQLGEVMGGISDAAEIGRAHGLDRAVAAVEELILEAEAQADWLERAGATSPARQRRERAATLRDARAAIEMKRESDR